MNPPAPKLREAATLVLVREDGRVFWVKRARTTPFLGSFHVFPGGARDREDASLEVTAARETFEETGVLLAPGAEKVPLAVRADLRARLLSGKAVFGEALAECGLSLDSSHFLQAGRWTTPPFSPVRFDTGFFLARMPRGQEPSVPSGPELESGEWISPASALAAWARDEALLAAPTKLALEALAATEGDPGEAEWLAGAAANVAAKSPPPGEWSRRVDFRPGIYVHPVRTPTLPPATHTNVVLVGDGEGLVAIDPASPYPEERAALDALVDGLAAEGRKLEAILLTHRHVDHVSGAEHLAARTGAPIVAHREVKEALRGSVLVTRTLEDGETIDLPADGPPHRGRKAVARRLRAVLTPGHAVGHLAFLEETSGSVVAGDLVAGFGWIIIDPPEGDMAVYLRSLERLRGLGARLVYPAHGPPITDAEAKIGEYVGHRLAREAKVLAAARAGATRLAAIVKSAYEDTPEALHALAARSALAHLIKLEAEGALPAGFSNSA